MIVYAGKQYWNEFNNWDEALFEDAVLPRDSYKFKIKQGIQTQKNDLRTANSGIAAQGTFFGVKSQAWQTNVTDPNTWAFLFNVANITNEWSVILWRPYVNAKDWDIVVWKSGVYAVTAQAMFIAPSSYSSKITSNTFSSSAAFYKFYVSLQLNWQPTMFTQWRWCGAIDTYSVFYVWWLDKDDRLNTWFLHTDTADTFTVSSSINLYRLS